jgi:hypothetical protein
MDEQNPRVGGERISGRGDELAAGRETSGTTGTTTSSTSSQRTRSASSTGARAGSRGSTAGSRPDERTREIRAEIEQTREDLSETVNAIQERLSPSNIASNAAESVKSVAREKARDIAESDSVQYVRANPIPTAMVTIGIAGLAWLAFGGRESNRYGRIRTRSTSRDWRTRPQYDRGTSYGAPGGYSTYEETRLRNTDLGYEDAETDTTGLSSSGAVERDYGTGYSAVGYSGARETGYDVDRTYRRAQNGIAGAQRHLRRAWDQNPLVLGAACMALGAVVGLAVPETERENELMGESRDNLLETVQETVKEKVTQVQQAATNAVGQVQDAAKSAVGLTSDDSSTPKSTT